MAIDVQKMRTLLLAKREELLQHIVGLMKADQQEIGVDDPSVGPQELEEVAVDALETEREQSIFTNEYSMLREVEEALRRIDAGTYGRCTVCGQPIPERRLETLPWVARCVRDEERAEQGDLS